MAKKILEWGKMSASEREKWLATDKSVAKRYEVLSPDGISINCEGYFTSKKRAITAFWEWVKRYEAQGYYSTIRGGERLRIAVSDLADYCSIITI
jgi:hypothetical protein